MKSFLLWLKESNENIVIDLSHFEKVLNKEKEGLIDYFYKRQEELNNFKFNAQIISQKLQNYPNIKSLMNSIGKADFRIQFQRLYAWLKRSNLVYEKEYRDIIKALENQNEITTGGYDVKNSIQSLETNIREILNKSNINMQKIAVILREAINRIPHWGNSPVIISAAESFSYGNHISLEPSYSAEIILGQRATFSLFFHSEAMDSYEIDDILEGGEEDDYFFGNNNIKSDYYMLINELRKPGSSQKGKILTLYTARPVQDREFYSNSKTLPINVFLTNSYNHAEGLAHDLGNDERRDVWKVKIDSKYLTQTLDGPVKYYMVNTENAPIISMSLY